MCKLFAAFLAATLVPVAVWADPVFPPGSGVGLEPPPGVAVTTGMVGLANGHAVIDITELPRDAATWFAAMREHMRSEHQDGLVSDFAAGGAHGFISRSQVELNGRQWRTWLVFLETSRETVTIQARVPADDRRVTVASVEAALRTITFRNAEPDRLSVLPFTVGNLQGFRPVTLGYPAEALVRDGILELTQGPGDPFRSPMQPAVTVLADIHAKVPDTGWLEYAEQTLRGYRMLGDTQVTARRLFDAGGVQWAEVRALGRKVVPVNILLFVRFGTSSNGIISVVCTVPASDPANYADRFRQLVSSIRPKG